MASNIPDRIIPLVFGKMTGLNPECTEILAYDDPYVLLDTAGRRSGRYSVFHIRTRRNIGRWDDEAAARVALNHAAAGDYTWLPPEET